MAISKRSYIEVSEINGFYDNEKRSVISTKNCKNPLENMAYSIRI
jgi:hypothetical protein